MQRALVPEFETVENLCGACSKSCSAKKSKGRNKLLNGREELGIRTAADAVLFQELCNEDGIDAKELVNVLRVAIEAGVAQAGNGQEIFGLIHEISTGTLLGTILGSGSENAAKILGTSVAKRLVRHSARKKNGATDEATALFVDSTGMCSEAAKALLTAPEGLEKIVKMCNVHRGWNNSQSDYLTMCQEVLASRLIFNQVISKSI